MPELHPVFASRKRRLVSTLLGGALLAATLVVAGCTEKLEGGAACPALCPAQSVAFNDTTFEAVVVDTTIGGFPTFGLSEFLLIANRKDTVETRGVIRFDILPTTFFPNKLSVSDSIRGIDSVYLLMVIDSTGVRGSTPATLEAFDVDTTVDDTVTSVVKSLFRADRLLGSVTFTPGAARDTLRVPLSKTTVMAKITAQTRLRVGLRFTGTNSAQLRVIGFQGGSGAPRLAFDPTGDTTYAPQQVLPFTSITDAPADQLLAYTVYSITDRGTTDAPAQSLGVGGWPSRRAYIRFALPAKIIDSSTIVRAELLLTQRRSNGLDSTVTLTLQPLIATASERVTDLRRALDLATEGYFAGLDSARLAPGDSGLRVINIVNLVRSWRSLDADVPRAIGLRMAHEGAEPAELRFFSSEAPAAVRPRLRITYLPRAEFAIP